MPILRDPSGFGVNKSGFEPFPVSLAFEVTLVGASGSVTNLESLFADNPRGLPNLVRRKPGNLADREKIAAVVEYPVGRLLFVNRAFALPRVGGKVMEPLHDHGLMKPSFR